MELWTVPEATGILHRHAGIGGAAVAALLIDPPLAADAWILVLQDRHLAVIALVGGEPVIESLALYDRIPFQICAGCTHEAGSRDQMLFPLPGGGNVPVSGSSPHALAMTTGLMVIALTHSLPALSEAENRVDFPINDDLLALILLRCYSNDPPSRE